EESRLAMPEAMCLSTVDDDGYPEGRIVLLKDHDARGFVFYTNLRSRKARSLAARPRAGLTFYWEGLGRQVRAQGDVEPVANEDADAYFASRPVGSRVGAWASFQSEVLESREALEARFRELEDRHSQGPVPRPPHWSGLRVVPRRVEFWQEGANRLHDRFVYRRDADRWTLERLYP
ncbi:MAG: pyridoxamine 5'-phosphate oxidase, partial [Gemmatimonadetes bacterium]|nr:pyridoxamine 5'-phosphate oxidase [Gemmatimonadota bacterium]